jgi:hypothetical protein
MNQTMIYNETPFIIPALHRHLLLNSGKGSKEETFTKEEKRLHEILSQIKGKGLFAVSIRTRLADRSMGSFRAMIKELNDQRLVAEKDLLRAIGSEAVTLIATIYNS